MKEFLTTKEVAELLNINEKKIYSLVSEGKIPGTNITGKWIFSKSQIEEYIKEKSLQTLKNFSDKLSAEKGIIVGIGSDDPVLQYIITKFNGENKDSLLLYSSVGSYAGLELLKDSMCHISFSHLYDFKENDFNFPFLNKLEIDEDVIVINLLYRNIGFLSEQKEISNFNQIIDENLTFINRQKNSGIRNFIEQQLQSENIDQTKIKGFENEVFTHYEVGINIVSKLADTGISLEFVSNIFKLKFNKIFTERFDLIIKKEIFFDKGIQSFLNFIKQENFLHSLKNFKGYDFSDIGKTMFKKIK
ncbi:MAG: hypothetical protein A2Y34_02340 [Spirochaetes bacterium GWC1_27_15]|nr:MAG: hypothetical protein A2Y34_02340 [Spirochaetes bacterium GWC1_27_15]